MDFSKQSHIKGEVYGYQIVLPLSDSMSVSTFSKLFICFSVSCKISAWKKFNDRIKKFYYKTK